MTNGEKLKEIFPYLESDETDLVRVLNMDNLKSWWNAEYKEPTKNVLAVDCIVDVLGSYTDLDIPYKREIAENILTKLPSVTPQEPTGKKFTKADIDAIVKAINTGWELRVNEILDKIRAEIDKARFVDKDTRICKNALASGLEVAMQIIDKYKAETEG